MGHLSPADRAVIKGHLDAVTSIADTAKAAGRELNAAERKAIVNHTETAKRLKGDAERRQTQADPGGAKEALAMAHDFANSIGLGGHPGKAVPGGRGDGSWFRAVKSHYDGYGVKDLISGTVTVPSLSASISRSEDRPRSILALIPFEPLDGTDSFAYLRETVRTHAASTVAAGQTKPTSTYTIEKVEDRARTIAHISEPIDRATLADVDLLQAYIEGALRDGVELELEAQILAGAGSVVAPLDDLTGILNVSGTQAQAFDTDRLITARKSVTKLENTNIELSRAAWAMTPNDWEAFELTTTTDAYVMGSAGANGNERLPVDRARRMLWGYPVVTSLALDDGTAILGDWGGSATVREREGVTIEWSEAPAVDGVSAFERNQRIYRGEGRWGFAATRPAAFVVVDLTA